MVDSARSPWSESGSSSLAALALACACARPAGVALDASTSAALALSAAIWGRSTDSVNAQSQSVAELSATARDVDRGDRGARGPGGCAASSPRNTNAGRLRAAMFQSQS